MMRLVTVATLSTLFGLAGCNQDAPDTSGAAGSEIRNSGYGQKENSFRLIVPLGPASLRQGMTVEIAVGIERARNFRHDVSLKFFSLPEGVKVAPLNAVIKHGDKSTTIAFTADERAATGEYTVKVFGHPEKGPDAEIEFRLTVVKE